MCLFGRSCNDNEHEKMSIIVKNYKEADTLRLEVDIRKVEY